MVETKGKLESLVSVRLMRLNATVQGVVVGLIAGLGIFIATNWLIIKGGPVVGPHLALLGQFFIGYRVTFVGSLIGFAYGFVLGFCVIFVYYVLLWTSRDLALGGRLPADWAPWIPNILRGAAGVVLMMWRVRSADQPIRISVPMFWRPTTEPEQESQYGCGGRSRSERRVQRRRCMRSAS